MNPLLPLEYLILLGLALLAVVGIFSWRSAALCPPRIRIVMLALRLMGVACLVMIALNPGRWRNDSQDQKQEWVVLLDASRSMATKDIEGETRWVKGCELVRKLFSIKKEQEIRLFVFASQLQGLESEAKLSGMEPEGETTDMVRAGKSVLDLYRGGNRRLKGILLFSDGRQIEPNSVEEFAATARSLDTPIYAIGLGGPIQSADLEVIPERRHYIGFKGQPLKLVVKLDARHLQNISPTLQLRNETRQKIAERKVQIRDQSSIAVEFEITPAQRDYSEYTVQVEPWEGEATLANNECKIAVSSLEEKIRVLFVEGMPSWESKFIAQLLQKQKNIRLTSIYRLASDKYLSIESEQAQPGESSKNVFPQDADGFKKYDVILFGRGVEYFLTPERIHLLKQFAREQGGAIVFARGKPYSNSLTELESLEPVEWGLPVEGEFLWEPTAAGEEVGLFGDVLPRAEDPLWQKLPAVNRAQGSIRSKAFTQVLAEGFMANGHRFPVVLSQRFGKGLVLVVNLEGFWQWDFFPTHESTGVIYRNFWPRILQWAVTYSDFLPGQEYSLHLSEHVVRPDQPILARLLKRSPEDTKEKPVLRIYEREALLQEVLLPPSGPGRWEGIFWVKSPGSYKVQFETNLLSETHLLRDVFQVMAPPSENDDRSANFSFLKELAEKSGGKMLLEKDLSAILESTGNELKMKLQEENAQWESRWSQGGFLFLILFLLGLEWFLRRRNGLI